MEYSELQKQYIDSVGGIFHQEAVDIIGKLEKDIKTIKFYSYNGNSNQTKPVDCVGTSGCKINLRT